MEYMKYMLIECKRNIEEKQIKTILLLKQTNKQQQQFLGFCRIRARKIENQ